MHAPSMAQPPSINSSSSSRPLQLDQWANTKAPLTSSQRASVNRLAEWLHHNSNEFKPQQEEHRQSQSSRPVDGLRDLSLPAGAGASDIHDEAPTSTPDLANTRSSESIALPDAGVPLASAQGFLAWYTQLSDSITSSTQTSHRQALQRISDTTSTADSLLAQLEACQVNVSELRAGTAFVQDSSRGIREQAQSLLDSQTHLDTLAEEIASRLSFFTLLPYATNMLSSPDSSIVYSQSFLDLMDQLEMALLFLQQEPAKSYRDAAIYRMRYAQCVTRAATLAKMAVVRDFKAESERAANKLKQLESSRKPGHVGTMTAAESGFDAKGKNRDHGDGLANGSSESALPKEMGEALFGGAEHQVAKLRPLIFELQKRASNTVSSSTSSAATAAEYESLLQECRLAWFQYRRPLLSRILQQRIVEIETMSSDAEPLHPLLQFARSGTQVVRSLVHREHDLYQQFFGAAPSAVALSPTQESDPALAAYLAEIADTLTARLRPRLFKEENLVVLAQTSAAISDTIHADDHAASWTRSMQAVVHEAQSRLIARAQLIVSSDIAGYTASEERGDLEFPERIKTYKASLDNLDMSRTSASAATMHTSATVKGQHRRGRSGAGLLDAALPTSLAASSSTAQQAKVELFTLPAPLLSTYYAPIEYMLELLFNLQARVPASAFRRIAIAAVDACLASVGSGSKALLKRTRGDSLEREDGLLFEIRQLEILRETVVSAELVLKQAHDQQVAEGGGAGHEKDSIGGESQLSTGTAAALVDLSSLVAAINLLMTNTGRLFYPTISAAVADEHSPASTQLNMEPCSSNVATRLQALIEQISKLWADSIVLPLRVYIDQSGAEASGAKFNSTYQAFETCIESIIPEKADKVMLWVEDQEVHRLIVASVVAHVDPMYAKFHEMKPADAGETEAVSRMSGRVRAEWGKVISL